LQDDHAPLYATLGTWKFLELKYVPDLSRMTAPAANGSGNTGNTQDIADCLADKDGNQWIDGDCKEAGDI
jgi:hypothetical protein